MYSNELLFRYYDGKWGALRRYCVTRWWSIVEMICRLLLWKDAVKRMWTERIGSGELSSCTELVDGPAKQFGPPDDATIKKILEDRPTFLSWQWTALELTVQILGPIRSLIKLLVCSVCDDVLSCLD
jgi:hypothetical protein